MLSVTDEIAFCNLSKTWVVFRPTSDCTLISVSFDHPPSTSMMILYWCTSYPLYCSFSSHLSGQKFIVFPCSSSLGYWSMGNSSLWSWLSCSHDSQTSHRPGWLAPPDDLHTQVHPTKLLLVLTWIPALAPLVSTTVVLPEEYLGHVRSRRTGLLRPCYVWTNTCCELLQYTWPGCAWYFLGHETYSLHFTSPGQLVCVFLLIIIALWATVDRTFQTHRQ